MEHLFQSPVADSERVAKAEAGTSQKSTTKNAFLDASTSHDTRTENEALSHSSTGDGILDDFAKSGSFRGRETDEVFATASYLWGLNPTLAFKLFLYLRLITRRIKGFYATENVQRGQGNRDESLRRILWVAHNHPVTFYKNLWLIPLVGSFKDLWTLMGMDTKNELKREEFYDLMVRSFANEDLNALAVKYMPQIRAKSKLKTDRARVLNALAKEFAKHMQMTYAEYRKFKSSNGEAHRWQQQISKGYFDGINFKAIPGKALMNLVNGKFLANNNLEAKYTEWIESQPIAKFTGYVYELYKKATQGIYGGLRELTRYQKLTFDKQFDGLIDLAKDKEGGIKGNIWIAMDTSGSMSHQVDKDLSALQVCVSLGIYFSALNEGAFKDHVIMFDNHSTKLQLAGTFTDKISQITKYATAWGSTNFQSVIDEIVRIRKRNPEIPIEDYPQTLLVISDMQFNPSEGYSRAYSSTQEKTNFEAAQAKLKAVGLPEMVFIWWNVAGRGRDVPVRKDDKGTMLFSGFDGAIITEILGCSADKEISEMTPEEAMKIALNQEIFSQVEL